MAHLGTGDAVTRYQQGAKDRLEETRRIDTRKYVVGARLRYLGPSDDVPPLFDKGDELIVALRNRGGVGISVVWPWEVGVLL